MKHTSPTSLILTKMALVLGMGLAMTTVNAALTDIAAAPMANTASAVVKPNLLFLLDDSGSMDWDFMPDSVAFDPACRDTGSNLQTCNFGDPAYNSAQFNGIAYSPAITYTAAVNYDGTSKTNYTTWTAVPNDAYGIQFSGTINLTTSYPDTVWCNTGSASVADRTAPFASGKCKRPIQGGVWTYPDATYNNRYSAAGTLNPYFYTISSLAWCSSKNASGFGTGTCQPKKTATFQYPKYGTGSDGFTRTDIVPTTANYPRAASRTDCSGAVGATGCTYAQEMTNFANWYAYYRSRMQMMKTAAGLAFKQVTDAYRVGFMTIHPGSPVTPAKFLPISDYTAGAGGQKDQWYTKFYSQLPGQSTPLREALSRAGRYFAHVTTGINNGITDDPMQYSCQQNFTIMSTDGFWNGNAGQRLDGSAIGNQDSDPLTAPRPLLDGSFQLTNVTSNDTLTQQICTANATVFGATPCGCAANFKRVKQQTSSSISTVVSRDGVVLSTTPSTATTYQDITACNAVVTTTTTPVTTVEEQKVAGTNMTTFNPINGVAAGANAAGTCASNGFARIKRRTTTYTQTVVTTGGVPGAPTFSGTTYAFADIGACTAATTQQVFAVTEVTQRVAPEGSGVSTGFTAAANGVNNNTTYTCSGSGIRTILLQRTTGYNKTVTTVGAGAPTTTYSANTSGPTYVLNNPCDTSAKTATNTITPTLTSTTITAGGGPAPAATTTTNGSPTSTSTGVTITGLDFTITPPSPPSAAATTAGPKTVVNNSSSSGPLGYSDTLADVAQYYYITDLRAPGSLGAAVSGVQLDVGTANNVPGQPGTDPQNDSANWQHMTTFTLGLGVDGQLTYASDYRTNPTGDFLAIKNGTKNWPQPVADTVTAVDDLWHAAVDGRGKYFSARDPAQLAAGLSDALVGVTAATGSAAAAATSNLEPVAGDNFAYVASYETVRWNGDVEARNIDLNTGAVSPTPNWSAQSLLDTLTNATTPGGNNRSIKRFNTSASNKLQDFTWVNLSAAEQAYFGAAWIGSGVAALSQWASLNAAQQTAAAGLNLVNFVRGDSSFESQLTVATANQLYRDRQHVLGDVVNGAPVYVKQISASYADAGYASPAGANFKECINTIGVNCSGIYSGSRDPVNMVGGVDIGSARTSTVYVAANDGMLHALDGNTGVERWAYVPNILIPNLYRLADKDYANRHQYYVDGSPTVGDVYDPVAAKWKTILVGGLAGGGRGFYALDVTDPATPIGLWEFNVRATASCPSATTLGSDKDDCDLGLSYGNPVITKLGDGTWVVVVTSGYNNVSPGDGKGYVYVLNPITGVILKKIQAMSASQFLNPGSTTTPLGLAKINNWVDDTNVNNTTLRVYGGDLQGYMWRFNLDTATAYAVARYTDPSGVGQPVTTKPELGEVSGIPFIYVGTGRYLGTSDLPSTQVQTIYGIKDATNGTAPTSPINTRGATVVAQTLTDSTTATGAGIRTATSNAVDVASKNGWRADLPNSGERVNVDPKLQLGTLIIGSNIPATSACTSGGTSYLNFLDYKTGGYIQSSGNTLAGVLVGNSLVVGISVVRLPNNKTVAIVTTSDNKYPNLAPPFSSPSPTGRRSSFRELQ